MDYGVADRLLEAWGRGERDALDRLMGLVYHELHRTASAILQNEATAFRTRPTSLVHDLFLELSRQGKLNTRGEQHFFAIAAFLMRQILVRNARARLTSKRGAGVKIAALGNESRLAIAPVSWNDEPERLLALNDALTRLEQIDPLKASIVDLRFFADLSIEATAQSLQLSPATVKRHWALARVWLFEQLNNDASGSVGTH
ncbi:MAG: RNA polymerase subunit sigma-70 [Acidobacteria bacterium]|nr:RNA polymerase subunit sigma-70 [Acidobacteriota bacterium]